MSYYLRVEGVNLGNFIMDTNDLSTIRGGGLLLLDSVNLVEESIRKMLPSPGKDPLRAARERLEDVKRRLEELKKERPPDYKQQKNTLKREKKRLQDVIRRLHRLHPSPHPPGLVITKGASWGLFSLDVDRDTALQIKAKVINTLAEDKNYRHATFVVDLHPDNGEKNYQRDRDSLQTINRWQQMQGPSLAIPAPEHEVCDFDKVRPAAPEDFSPKEGRHISASVRCRREYGRRQRQDFYRRVTQLADLAFTRDLGELGRDPSRGILDGKIAYIYIDGNNFGAWQRGARNPGEQCAFDQAVRMGREKVLTAILERIRDDPAWQYGETQGEKTRLRLETLLWGGDEIIWVVPAWQGWWLVQTFYELARASICYPGDTPLRHATGLVFCHHNAPIRRIDDLARRLAENFAKMDRNRNLIAYQVLETFDHAGTDLRGYRQSRIQGLGDIDHLLVDADDMGDIESCIRELQTPEIDFPRRKIHQILYAWRNNDERLAREYEEKLPEAAQKSLSALQACFGGRQAHWLHLMDLWDYVSP